MVAVTGHICANRDSIPSALGTDAVEQAGVVVGDDETTVRSNHYSRRPTPALAAGILPTGDEIARRNRRALKILEVDEQELRRGRRLPVPGPVLGDDEIAT